MAWRKKNKFRHVKQIYELLLPKQNIPNEVSFDAKVSSYIIIKNPINDRFSCMRVSSWADQDIEKTISVRHETVLKNWNEIYDMYGEYRV